MATISQATRSRDANPVTMAAASAGGDVFANTGKELLLVRHTNSGGVAVTLTIATQSTVDGQAVADKTVAIDPGELHVLGEFPTQHYNDGNGQVVLSWSSETDIEVGVLAG